MAAVSGGPGIKPRPLASLAYQASAYCLELSLRPHLHSLSGGAFLYGPPPTLASLYHGTYIDVPPNIRLFGEVPAP